MGRPQCDAILLDFPQVLCFEKVWSRHRHETLPSTKSDSDKGKRLECLNSAARRYTMPAFMFEKISPPVSSTPAAPTTRKRRGVIVRILDRFVDARVKRGEGEAGSAARAKQESSD